MQTLKQYYAALKPERTYANVMTTAAGFLFASKWLLSWRLLLATLVGTTLIVMSACAANNCMDRELDSRMPRTKRRPTVTGQVLIARLVGIAIILGVSGFVCLALWVNWRTVALGLVGYVDYVVLYAWSKRHTPWSTLIGTISGAVPLVAGYVAVTNRYDLTALLLGLVMIWWQMPHFYSIGIFRLEDYRAGSIPIWPVKYGVHRTQLWILAYTMLYIASIFLLAFFGSAGLTFACVLGILGIYWLFKGIVGLKTQEPIAWARGMFGFSLVTLLILSAGVAVAPLLP
jgi:protoheme IX farnesyltransferase